MSSCTIGVSSCRRCLLWLLQTLQQCLRLAAALRAALQLLPGFLDPLCRAAELRLREVHPLEILLVVEEPPDKDVTTHLQGSARSAQVNSGAPDNTHLHVPVGHTGVLLYSLQVCSRWFALYTATTKLWVFLVIQE